MMMDRSEKFHLELSAGRPAGPEHAHQPEGARKKGPPERDAADSLS